MKIYTKTGDRGTTALIGGTRVPKSDGRIEAYGTVDELNAWIGVLGETTSQEKEKALLKEIQDRLFTIGSSLACDPEKEPLMKIPDLLPSDIELLEKDIDRMNAEIPPMKFFVLPGGHLAVAHAHVARCVCRRAERACVLLQENQAFVEPLVIQYLNRLSDHLFVLSRYWSHVLGATEIPWKPRVK